MYGVQEGNKPGGTVLDYRDRPRQRLAVARAKALEQTFVEVI
jgi:hypothetical protein